MSDPFSNKDYYDLVFVGRGYSVSTYLLMADLSWCKKICIVAGPDAWSSVLRGESGIINHALHVYGREAGDRSSPEEKTTLRNKLVDNNASAIEAALKRLTESGVKVDIVNGLVASIEHCDVPLTEDTKITRGPKDDPVFSLDKKKDEAIGAYKLTCDEWNKLPEDSWRDINVKNEPRVITALKVVYGGGSGPHKVPGYLTGNGLLGNDYNANKKTITLPATPSPTTGILGLDAFMRLSAAQIAEKKKDFGKGKKLALIGPNAGLDAAMEAVDRNFELIYLFGSKTSKPFWLGTKHYTFEDRDDINKDAIEYVNNTILRYDRGKVGGEYTKQHEGLIITRQNDNKYQIKLMKYTNDGTTEDTIKDVDFIIYSIGQSPDFTEILTLPANPQTGEEEDKEITTRIGPAKVLSPILNNEYLFPIYDINRRFGDDPFETALGLKTEGTDKYQGLEVIGAAAFAFSRGNDPVRKQPYVCHSKNATLPDPAPSVRDTMLALVKKIHRDKSIVMPEQLGGVRSQIEAITGFDLMSTVSVKNTVTPPCHDFLQAAQSFLKKLKEADLKDANKRKELVAGFDFTGKVLAAYAAMANNWTAIRDYARVLLDAMPAQERKELKEQGIENAEVIRETAWDSLDVLYESLRALRSDEREGNFKPEKYDSLPKQIEAAKKWVTNVLTVMQQSELFKDEYEVDFSGMDRNQLAVLLAARYPSIRPADWPAITDKIIKGRDSFPWGYKEDHVKTIKESLGAVNKNPGNANQFTVPSQ